ncbi:MAG: hypothetical protein JKX70_08020 [Phycisphaerales bacterium]|nr:hypothetical protein [Phycisphaerales bacterium]
MKTVTKCLFGGALVGAGLCSTAIAGGVDGVFTWNNGSAYVVTPFGAYSSHHTGGNFDISSDSPLGRAYARADQSGLTLFAESFAGDVGGYEARIGGVSVASVEAYFHVSQTMSVTMTWDF